MSAKMMKKLSPATLCPDLLKRLDVEGAPAEVLLFDIYGFASGVKASKPGAERPWTSFVGEFEAVRVDNGEVFNSGRCFLPQPMEDMLFGRIMQSKEASGNASVQFALRVSIVKPTGNRQSATGYEYSAQSLIKSEDTPPMVALREQAKAALLALPAPTAAKPAAAVASGKK